LVGSPTSLGCSAGRLIGSLASLGCLVARLIRSPVSLRCSVGRLVGSPASWVARRAGWSAAPPRWVARHYLFGGRVSRLVVVFGRHLGGIGTFFGYPVLRYPTRTLLEHIFSVRVLYLKIGLRLGLILKML
jgi:hypothetical protein